MSYIGGGGAKQTDKIPQENKRRATIKFHANTDKVNVVKDPAAYRADREMNLAHFKELMRIFRLCSNNNTGTISLEDFKTAFSKVLGEGLTDEQMTILFMKIDANTDNEIDWDDFSTYMLLRADGQKAMKEEAETRLFENQDTTHVIQTPHKDPIVRIQFIDATKKYLTCGRDGTLCYWNEKLKLQRCFRNAGRPKLGEGQEMKRVTLMQKLATSGTPHRWIQDCVSMDNVHKVAMASDDHQITIYDSNTLERSLCLDLQGANPISLDYFTDKNNPDASESMLFYGTDTGYVNCFTFNNDRMFQLGVRQKDRMENIFLEKEGTNKPLKYFGSVWKRKAHGDWAIKVRYIHDLKAIVSCSPDPKDSFVVAMLDSNHKWNFTSISVHKGVTTFAYCGSPVTFITGGSDRQIRLWNPHRLNRPTACLKGHSSPIVDITTNDVGGQMISISSDHVIKIWDLRRQVCVQTIANTDHHRYEDVTSIALLFSSRAGGKILTGSTVMSIYELEQKAVQDAPKSHDFPVRGAMYNSTFKQVVSGCDGGVINVWDAFNGQKTFRFSEAHGTSEITAMTFDSLGRRLITGGRDGSIKVWNFNNGQLLQDLVKKDTTEVTGLIYIDMKDSTYIVATGWNRKVSLFADDADLMTIYPSFTWPDEDSSHQGWHDDDILSMAFSPPSILATASYDGEIVITNLYSGHILHRLRPMYKDEIIKPLNDTRSIDKIIFLTERATLTGASSLVSAGADGLVRFWNIHLGILTFEQQCTNKKGSGIFAMVSNAANTLLLVADSEGWVSLYDIKETCLNLDEITPNTMPLIRSFRAFVSCITCMDLSESSDMIIVAADATIRCFTTKGDFVGIYGQSRLWEMSDPNTYCDGEKPIDVLQAESIERERAEDAAAALLQQQMDAFERAQSISGLEALPSSLRGSQVDNFGATSSSKIRDESIRSSSKIRDESFRSSSKIRDETRQSLSKVKDESTRSLKSRDDRVSSSKITDTGSSAKLLDESRKPIATRFSAALGTNSASRIRTADILTKSYSSWFSQSLFARENFHDGNVISSKRKRFAKLASIQPGQFRIYNRLQPIELADVSKPPLNDTIVVPRIKREESANEFRKY